MGKNRKRKVAGLVLPEEIIQHIQSFLDGKEAAQTTLLSRSWYQAWLTRPNLDFDQKHFSTKSDHDFWKLATTTMERYEKINIKIDTLRLWIHKKHSLVNELIIKALKTGATCLDFKTYDRYSEFAFPHQVFGFENLTRLSVNCFKIGLVEEDNERLIIRCSRLKFLTLEVVLLEDNTIWDIISRCPLIEDFSLSTKFDERILPEFFGKQHLSNEFHKLKSLYLSKVRVDHSFFNHFSCKFPCLEDLTVYNCDGCTEIQIFSLSLERVTLGSSYIINRFKFDVPRIRKFTLMVPNIPLLSFGKITTSNWSSNIHIERESAPNASWFLELSKLLKKLRSLDSQVALSLSMWSEKPLKRVGKFQGLRNKPEVFLMRINGPYAAFPDFYSSLFKYCRPSSIEPYWIPRFKRVDEFVWKRKMQQVCLDSCIAHQKMGGCDLRKVKVAFYDKFVSEWRNRLVDDTNSMAILGDVGDVVDDEQLIFFDLKWGPKSLGIR